MNTPVNFEIAKLLKEKGFDEFCSHAYKEFESPVLYIHQDKKYNNSFKKEWQNIVRKNSTMDNALIKRYSAPTISEVVMWLYEKHGIWVFILPQDRSSVDFRVKTSIFPSLPLFIMIVKYEQDLSMIEVLNSSNSNSKMYLHFDEPTEAYESAIKYILNKLL